MTNSFDIVFSRLTELQSLVANFPLSIVILSLSAASLITMLITAPIDYRFERMRLMGITRTLLAMIMTGIVALGVLSFGLDLIKTARNDIPGWIDLALLSVCSVGFMLVCYIHLRRRDSFTLSRFTNAVVIPLATPIIPFLGILQSILLRS